MACLNHYLLAERRSQGQAGQLHNSFKKKNENIRKSGENGTALPVH